jgi:hypothetical protein
VLPVTRAAAARHGLYDLDLFAGTGVLDKMADVDDALEAGVRAIVIRIFGGWVRFRCARLVHVNTSVVLAAPPGNYHLPAGASYVV